MICPECKRDDVRWTVVPCPDPEQPGETLEFMVCTNCDWGVNEHTEGLCECEETS